MDPERDLAGEGGRVGMWGWGWGGESLLAREKELGSFDDRIWLCKFFSFKNILASKHTVYCETKTALL